jgi:ankyrin repeat protein
MIAAARGHNLIVRQLLAFGADSTKTNKQGNTALILAMYDGHVDVVKTLLKKGNKKQLFIRNKQGKTPLDFAKALKKPQMIKLIKDALATT